MTEMPQEKVPESHIAATGRESTPDLLRRELVAYAGIAATLSKRGDVEMRYFKFHQRVNGVRLRGKYRP